MDAELLALCKQSVSRYAFTSYDVNNDFSWSATATTFAARIEYVNKLIRDINGQESLSTCQIYANGDTIISERDKIYIAGATVLYPEILAIEKNPDENGVMDHIVIYTK